MNKNNSIIVVLILILFILATSGCLEYLNFDIDDGSITYEMHPTKIRYTISYGYRINCNGTGKYEVYYDCDLPELLQGSVSSQILHRQDYKNITLANNTVLQWNISGENNHNYELGVRANVEAESFLVSDLNGNEALTLQGIKTNYPDIFHQYCTEQTVENMVYIDPYNPSIKSTASDILDQADTNNSFLLAKELFIWLKQNTVYQIHTTDNSVQPAYTTYQLKTGDCDDLSFLYISLCRSIDISARFIKGVLIEETDGVISAVAHVWVEVFVGNNIGNDGWIPVECACSATIQTEINQNFGVESVGHLRLFGDDGSNESMNTSISGPRASYDTNMDIDMVAFIEIENYNVLESKELFIKNDYRTYKQHV